MSQYELYFQPWELRIAKTLVAGFLDKHRQLPADDFDDLLQESLSHWVLVRERYDPREGASPQTFMWKVISRKLAQIWREMGSDKRKVSHQTVSLDEPINESEGSDTYLDQLTNQEAGGTEGDGNQLCLKIDLVKAVNRLSPEQKELCKYLGDEDMSVQEISSQMKMSRASVYDEMKRIRKFFYNNGLGEELKKR